jgi:hypothetical protein
VISDEDVLAERRGTDCEYVSTDLSRTLETTIGIHWTYPYTVCHTFESGKVAIAKRKDKKHVAVRRTDARSAAVFGS